MTRSPKRRRGVRLRLLNAASRVLPVSDGMATTLPIGAGPVGGAVSNVGPSVGFGLLVHDIGPDVHGDFQDRLPIGAQPFRPAQRQVERPFPFDDLRERLAADGRGEGILDIPHADVPAGALLLCRWGSSGSIGP